jgi:hypothetical protein
MKPIALLVLTAVPFCLTCEMRAATVNPAVEYTTVSSGSDSRPFTLGYEFTTSVNFTVDALGYWDDGLVNNHQVGIWDTSGNLLVSTTVLGSDALTGHFRYHSISTFSLLAGTYVIGGEFLGNNNLFPESATGLTSVAGYTWITDLQIYGAGLNFPTVSTGGGYGDNGIFLADFSVNGSTAAVPEPATWSLMLSAAMLAGVGYRRKFQAGFRK